MKPPHILLLILTLCMGDAALAEQSHIARSQLEDMFANIQAGPGWNMKGNMLWGYFFTGPNKAELEEIGARLVSMGYHMVEIFEREPDADQARPEWQLHVERVEIQSVDTLYATNAKFEDLAGLYSDVVYDGMDVGPAD